MRIAWLMAVVVSVWVGMEAGARGQAPGELAAVRAERVKAEGTYNAVVRKLRTEFEGTEEYKTALAEEQAAEGKVKSTRQAVLAVVGKDPAYIAAKGAQAREEADLGTARAAGDQEGIFAASKAKLDSAAAVAKLENAALDKDGAYTAAAGALEAAQGKLATLVKAFDESIKTNVDVIAAKKTLDEAIAKQKSVEAAANATAAAAARDSAARAAAARAAQQSAPRPAPPVMHGGY